MHLPFTQHTLAHPIHTALRFYAQILPRYIRYGLLKTCVAADKRDFGPQIVYAQKANIFMDGWQRDNNGVFFCV